MCYYNTCSAISRPFSTPICVNIAQPGSAILTHLFLVCDMYWNCTVVEKGGSWCGFVCMCVAVYITSLANLKTISRP